MNTITFQTTGKTIDVFLDLKYVGRIKKDSDGWRYYPKGQKTGGDPFPTSRECKQSLESE